ncbi:MAG TPA: hypothetical protein DCF33_21705 [Saprospirales bacterium]|nr:hypothetical protein [Saprospirales bacterium]
MKNNTFFAIFLLLLLGACKKETLVITDIDEYVTITEGVNSKFNIEYKPSAQVDFIIGTKDEAKISEIKVYKQYVSAGGATSPTVLHATLKTFPAMVNVTLEQALNGLEVNAVDFNFGDKVVFTISITADNKVFESNRKFEALTVCPSDLGGTYKVTTTYSRHDFLPNFSTFSDTITITEVGAGKYTITDFSGGLYSQGPYRGAYGTNGIMATIEDVCNTITWTNVSDPWGQVVPTPGGTNNVDGNTGVITISWKCQAYSEQGVSVYTPL